MNKNLYSYEKTIIKAIIDEVKDDKIRVRLTEQLDNLMVKGREFTGVGFYTDFFVKKDLFIAECGEKLYGGIGADIVGLKYGAGFILWLENGGMSTLEGYSYNEFWPQETIIEKIYAVPG